jgi:hypothetical protein
MFRQSSLWEGDWLMEPPYWALFLLLLLCTLAGIVGIVKARRRRENTYYWVSGISFLVVITVIAALFNQFLLSFAMIIATGIISIGLLPRVMALYGEEIVKQKQETDVSAPLKMRDFLTWKAWIKLKAIYGFRKMIILYSILNMGIIAAGLLTLIALGLITPLMAVSYTISTTILSFIIGYRQIWKALKDT